MSKALSPFAKSLLNSVRLHCIKNDLLLDRGAPTVIACSGGVDSISAVIVAKLLKFNVVGLAYVNHMMRGSDEVAQDIVCVRRAAEVCPNATVHVLPVHNIPTNETSARVERHAKFMDLARDLGAPHLRIITGHHMDDQVETFIMRALKGGNSHTLQCARPMLRFDPVTLVRPLLTVPKCDLIKLVVEWGLSWHEDVTNKDTSIERNFIRHELLPQILTKFPNAKGGLVSTMQSLWSGAK